MNQRFYWFVFFLAIQLAFPVTVGTNPSSRWASLCALVEDGTPRIDAYRSSTIDWSQTPDGHFYSNKAPGPVLMAYPIFKGLDWWLTAGIASREERDRIREQYRPFTMRVLSFLLQVLPFALLAWLWDKRLAGAGVSQQARSIFLPALLLGNTAVVFLNTYFGHGLTAVCALALFYFLAEGSVFGTVLFFSLGVLCDYSSGLFLLPLLPAWISWARERGLWSGFGKPLLAGAFLPAVAWVGYHGYCFGSPLRIANQYQNPLFLDQAQAPWNLWGIFSLPSPGVLLELLFGPSRGLLWTQPWVLFLAVSLCFYPPRGQRARWARFAFSNLGLLLLLNTAFGAWHGGDTPGPRYLSAGLVLLPVVLAGAWDAFPLLIRQASVALVALSVVFQLVFLSVYRAFPPAGEPLWRFYWDQWTGPHGTTPLLRLLVAVPIAMVLFFRARFAPRQ